jgi:hypothetical protein
MPLQTPSPDDAPLCKHHSTVGRVNVVIGDVEEGVRSYWPRGMPFEAPGVERLESNTCRLDARNGAYSPAPIKKNGKSFVRIR